MEKFSIKLATHLAIYSRSPPIDADTPGDFIRMRFSPPKRIDRGDRRIKSRSVSPALGI